VPKAVVMLAAVGLMGVAGRECDVYKRRLRVLAWFRVKVR
jgi:hypothetical protein